MSHRLHAISSHLLHFEKCHLTNTIFSFERELKNKLAQKASGVQNEETVLLRAFKYFDLNNNNTVEPEEFAKAIEKIGIMIPTRQVRRGL